MVMRLQDGSTLSQRVNAKADGSYAQAVVIDSGEILTGPAAQSALNFDLLTGTVNGYMDVSQYSMATIQIVGSAGITSGSIFFEQSNNAVNWYPAIAIEQGVIGTTPIVTALALPASANRAWAIKLNAPYLRVRISAAFVGGTVQAFTNLRNDPFSSPIMTLTSPTSSPINVANRSNFSWNDLLAAQAANAVINGISRDAGVITAPTPYTMFNAIALSDQAGSMRLEISFDSTTWFRATLDTAVAINTPVILSIPVMARYHRVVYTNGATAQSSFMLNTSFTAA